MATDGPARAPVESSELAPEVSLRSSHPYTCNSCQVAFRNSELQRTHMHSDWHRYNLKRRVASLPPISSEVFAEKVVNAQASSTAAAAKASFERACHVCQRTYYSENAFQNHIGSQKHKLRLAGQRAGAGVPEISETGSLMSSTFSLGEPIRAGEAVPESEREADIEFSEVVDAMKNSTVNEAEPISRRPTRPHHSAEEDRPPHPLSPATVPSTDPSATDEAAKEALVSCLFCNYRSPSLPLNVSHMGKFHGLFIPERQYLVDLPGLIQFLHQKIFYAHQCLHCGKTTPTTNGAQTHMRDKGHCMIAFESEVQMIEVGEFYDFRSTYSDEDDVDGDGKDEPMGPYDDSKPRTGRKGFFHKNGTMEAVAGDGSNVGDRGDDGDGWETDSSASSLDSADLTAVPLGHRHLYERLVTHPHHSHHDPRPHHLKDGWHSHAHHTHPHAVYHSDYELHLPSGRSVGHRSLARYYRQNLRDHPSNSEREAASGRAAIEDGHADTNNNDNNNALQHGRRSGGIPRDQMGLAGVSDASWQRVREVRHRERRNENRERARYQWGVDKRGNSQKHFRDPLLQ
ncbi:MAG: hypothetical protein M1815_006113 [Lichina confinis]|nr:MAG: hypothetical protein M1815_006113 [Lichina confinis]